MNIERALKTPGWMSEGELAYLAQMASRCRSIAEIGSWEGRSTVAMAENTKGVVYAVDSWTGSMDHRSELSVQVLPDFLRNTQGLINILPVPLPSMRACAVLKEFGLKFEMVFIDASHEFEDVFNDITHWRELLVPGGILCGHDYGREEHAGVRRAVDLLVPKFCTRESIWTTEEA
jgi:predicted O-methyltransferase YrrM